MLKLEKFHVVTLCFISLLFFSSCEKEGNGSSTANTFTYNFSSQPTTLNALSSTDNYATLVQEWVIEGLAYRDSDTYEWKPALATSWEISEDGLTFTFNLREGVKWHDGKPLTAEDIKFTFDALTDKDNKYNTATKKPYLENIESCTILAPNKIQFKAKKKYFGNFDVVAGGIIRVVPKHLYENPSEDQEKELNKTLVGTGPYKFVKWRKGNSIHLEKNENWWGNEVYPEMYNFEKIRIRFIKDSSVALQRHEKGDIDYLPMSPEEFTKKTDGKKWGKEVFKVKYENSAPKNYGFIGWNLKNPLFKDREIRVALNKLVDRQKMIDKFTYGLSLPATGPWYRQSEYADPNVKPIMFDSKGALQLLRKNGWKDTDGDQILDKMIDGKKTPFKFTLLNPNKEFNKYLVIFQQDAKKVGIDVDIKVIEWNTFISLLNERNFDSVILAWSAGSVDMDPKQIWHSESIDNGGSNFISYSNPRVDELIEKARTELDKEKRIPMMQEVYREIAHDAPYVFLFNAQYGFYGHRKNVERPKDTFNYEVGIKHWSLKQPGK
tara:strand:+ start:128775 stop:130424 length:1650 start_codon:yes stop_codon:yes gene_type:complete